uniref:Uncharacterized protein n=1 Tax=Arundo donax TaxID=35708 RepID=A0A0A9DTZ9_ARUDO
MTSPNDLYTKNRLPFSSTGVLLDRMFTKCIMIEQSKGLSSCKIVSATMLSAYILTSTSFQGIDWLEKPHPPEKSLFIYAGAPRSKQISTRISPKFILNCASPSGIQDAPSVPCSSVVI